MFNHLFNLMFNHRLFKKGELKLLWPFYLYCLIYGLSAMVLPFMIIYFRDLGFSYLQISIIMAAFSVSMFLFEIPTGAFADAFSRKYSVVIGFIITALSTILIALFSDFYILVLLLVIVGIGMTFVSGAEEAWIIDNLSKSGRKDLHHEFFIKSQSLASLGIIFAPLLGSILVGIYSITILWYVFGFGFLVNAIILTLFAKELYKPKKIILKDYFQKTYNNSKRGLQFSLSHKTVFLLIMGSILVSLMMFGDNGWQPFLVYLGLPKAGLGITYSVLALFGVIVPFLSKFLVKYKIKNVVSVTILVRMLLLLSLLFIFPPFYLVAAAVFILFHGFSFLNEPFLQTYFHKFVPQKLRATVTSTFSMGKQLVFAISSIVGGFMLDLFGPQKVLAWGSIFGILAVIVYLKIKE